MTILHLSWFRFYVFLNNRDASGSWNGTWRWCSFMHNRHCGSLDFSGNYLNANIWNNWLRLRWGWNSLIDMTHARNYLLWTTYFLTFNRFSNSCECQWYSSCLWLWRWLRWWRRCFWGDSWLGLIEAWVVIPSVGEPGWDGKVITTYVSRKTLPNLGDVGDLRGDVVLLSAEGLRLRTLSALCTQYVRSCRCVGCKGWLSTSYGFGSYGRFSSLPWFCDWRLGLQG